MLCVDFSLMKWIKLQLVLIVVLVSVFVLCCSSTTICYNMFVWFIRFIVNIGVSACVWPSSGRTLLARPIFSSQKHVEGTAEQKTWLKRTLSADKSFIYLLKQLHNSYRKRIIKCAHLFRNISNLVQYSGVSGWLSLNGRWWGLPAADGEESWSIIPWTVWKNTCIFSSHGKELYHPDLFE